MRRVGLNRFTKIGAWTMLLASGACAPQGDFESQIENFAPKDKGRAMSEDLVDRIDKEYKRIEEEYGVEPELIDWGGRTPREAYLFLTVCALERAANGGVIALVPIFSESWEFLIESFLFFEFHELAEVLRKVPEVHRKFTEQYGDQNVPIDIIDEWFGEFDNPFFDAVTDLEYETYEQIARFYFNEESGNQ